MEGEYKRIKGLRAFSLRAVRENTIYFLTVIAHPAI